MSTLKLVSSDGMEFCVTKDCVLQSRTLKALIDTDPCFIENNTQFLTLPIKGVYLKRIVEFLEFKQRDGQTDEFEIADDEAIDLLDVAAYLRI